VNLAFPKVTASGSSDFNYQYFVFMNGSQKEVTATKVA
jgi:hypothetical protein